MKKVLNHVLSSFSILIFILFIEIIILRDAVEILAVTLIIISLAYFKKYISLKKMIFNILLKLVLIFIIYYISSNTILYSLPARIELIILCFVILFFGSGLYAWIARDHIQFSSLLSLFFSIPLFILSKNVEYSNTSIGVVIPIIILLNALILFYRNNNNELRNISTKRGKIPIKLVQNNRVMVFSALLITLIIGFIKEIVWFISFVGRMIVVFISLIIKLILALLSPLSGEETKEGGEGSGSVLDLLPTDESKGSIILDILTYVLYAISAIVVAFLLFILIKKVMSGIKKLFRYLLGNINRKKPETFFVDIVETKNIFDVAKNKIFSGIKEYIDETGERFRAKSKREEIRYITKQKIRKLIKAGYVLDTSKTVNEIFGSKENKREVLINEDLVNAYDKARYSSENIEDIDLEKLK